MTNKEKAVNGYNERISELQKMRDNLSLLPDKLTEMKGAHIYDWLDDELRVDLPLTKQAPVKVRRLLRNEWESTRQWVEEESGSWYFEFYHKETEIPLSICFQAGAPGSTCTRKQVGTKQVPIYEIEC